VPIGLALIAGGLSTLNPCGFSLLPAMLSPYVSRDAADDPSAISRLGASLRAGGRVTAGFLSVFIVVGVPTAYGFGGIVRAMPWAGAVAGLGIMIAGLLTLSGRHIGFNFNTVLRARPSDGAPSMYLFGVAYAVASLGCTLPVFLSVVGASLAVRGPGAATVVLAGYGVGMGAVMMTLALVASGLRDQLIKILRRALPRMQHISGVLLLVAGVYLSYYWLRTPVRADRYPRRRSDRRHSAALHGSHREDCRRQRNDDIDGNPDRHYNCRRLRRVALVALQGR
jgi:cytochrome c-type biogenesis protein